MFNKDYCLYLFAPKGAKISAKPIVVNGISLDVIYPEIIKQFEMHPLGKIDAVLAYDDLGNYCGRYTAKDYLEKKIPFQT